MSKRQKIKKNLLINQRIIDKLAKARSNDVKGGDVRVELRIICHKKIK
jgi:hypothetical protein